MKKTIPSTLKLANLLLGFPAVLLIFKFELLLAMLLILCGIICDYFEGNNFGYRKSPMKNHGECSGH